jgi:hypothetical protein
MYSYIIQILVCVNKPKLKTVHAEQGVHEYNFQGVITH